MILYMPEQVREHEKCHAGAGSSETEVMADNDLPRPGTHNKDVGLPFSPIVIVVSSGRRGRSCCCKCWSIDPMASKSPSYPVCETNVARSSRLHVLWIDR
jgi:hypothetical protein